LQRKAEKEENPNAVTPGQPVIQYDEEGQPQALDFHDF
jgi:hypothetical protein